MIDPNDAGTGGDHILVRKRDAAEATLRWVETRSFRLGTADCIRMTAFHLRSLGYQVKLPPAGSYRGVRSAVEKLQATGHASIADALDALGLQRIPPAAAIMGDIVEMQAPGLTEHGLSALTIAMGNGRVAGWHEEVELGVVMQPLAMRAAWRVDPK